MPAHVRNIRTRGVIGLRGGLGGGRARGGVPRRHRVSCPAEPVGAACSDVPAITVIWSTDFSNGWGGWLDTPWNVQPQGEVQRPVIANSPTGTGQCGRFHLDGGQQRNESQPDAAQDIGEGDTLVVRFTDYLTPSPPIGARRIGSDTECAVFAIGSGTYAFVSSGYFTKYPDG